MPRGQQFAAESPPAERVPEGSRSLIGAGDVARRLQARCPEIETSVLARVQASVPDLMSDEAADAEYVAGLQAAVSAAINYALTTIERGGECPQIVPSATFAQARRAARRGVSLDAVLRRYMIGQAVLSDYVFEEVAQVEPAIREGLLRDILNTEASLLDRLVVIVAREYMSELQGTERSIERRRVQQVQTLLAGGERHLDAAIDPDIDYELDGEHLGAIARGEEAEEVLRGLAARLDRRLLSVPCGAGTVWAWLGGRRVFDPFDLSRALAALVAPRTFSLVIGEPASNLDGWRLTHRQAQAALLVALRRPAQLTRYADVALLAAALKDETLARSLLEIYLAPLDGARDAGEVSRQTLRAYLAADRNVSSAAVALGIARSTLEKRLSAIEGRLGRPVCAHSAELDVALRLDGLPGIDGAGRSAAATDARAARRGKVRTFAA